MSEDLGKLFTDKGMSVQDVLNVVKGNKPKTEEKYDGKTAEEIVGILREKRIPCAPINTIAEVIRDPQAIARESFKNMEFYEEGVPTFTVPGNVIKMSESPGGIYRGCPQLGEHNEEVYKDLLGFDDEKLSYLRKENII